MSIQIEIDGVTVTADEGATLVDAAAAAGVYRGGPNEPDFGEPYGSFPPPEAGSERSNTTGASARTNSA